MASAPIIATGTVYAPYIAAARQNLEDLLRLTQRLRDPAFEREAQRMLDALEDASTDALAMIEEAEVNCAVGRRAA